MSRISLERALPAGERILLDSSSLIAHLNGGEAVSVVVSDIVDDFVRSGRNQAIISMVSVMELLVRPLRLGAQGPYRHVLDFLTRFPNLCPVEVDLVIVQEAASQRAAHRLSASDALVVATGIVAQVGHLVTNDAAWQTRLQPVQHRVRAIEYTAQIDFLRPPPLVRVGIGDGMERTAPARARRQ